VSVARSTATPDGPALSGMSRAGCPHPLVVFASHRAMLMTEMLLLPALPTYRVRVRSLIAAATGKAPRSLIVATGRAQPRVTVALQAAPLITETVFGPELSTYTVSVGASTSAISGARPTRARAITRQCELAAGEHVAVLRMSTTSPGVAEQVAFELPFVHWIGT